jgi:hypothetical protein
LLKDRGMKTEVPRCPHCSSSHKLKAMRLLENGSQVCENCGHIVFRENKAFWCPCQKCLSSRFETMLKPIRS